MDNSTMGIVLSLLLFIGGVSGFLAVYHQDTDLNPNVNNFGYEDSFTSTNTGFFTELSNQYDLLKDDIDRIPYGTKISYFIGGCLIIVVIFVLRGI